MGLTGKRLSIFRSNPFLPPRKGVPTDLQKHQGCIICSRRQQMRRMFSVNTDRFISLELLLKNLLYVRPIKVSRGCQSHLLEAAASSCVTRTRQGSCRCRGLMTPPPRQKACNTYFIVQSQVLASTKNRQKRLLQDYHTSRRALSPLRTGKSELRDNRM